MSMHKGELHVTDELHSFQQADSVMGDMALCSLLWPLTLSGEQISRFWSRIMTINSTLCSKWLCWAFGKSSAAVLLQNTENTELSVSVLKQITDLFQEWVASPRVLVTVVFSSCVSLAFLSKHSLLLCKLCSTHFLDVRSVQSVPGFSHQLQSFQLHQRPANLSAIQSARDSWKHPPVTELGKPSSWWGHLEVMHLVREKQINILGNVEKKNALTLI